MIAKYVVRSTSLGMGTCEEAFQYATCSAVGESGYNHTI
jgi:hypothetical protein